jgi:hypothetical protein
MYEPLNDPKGDGGAAMVKHTTSRTRTPLTPRSRARRQRAASGGFWASDVELEALADQQGVTPASDFTQLLGDFWPESESADDFIAATRTWHSQGH